MQCTHYIERTRCGHAATHSLIAPDGSHVPCYLCEQHGQAVIDEYATKLGEQWSLQPIEPNH